jgi:hypothetical protein
MDLRYLMRSGLGIPDYWHPHLELQKDFMSGRIARYPVSMDVKADYPGPLNDTGVPIVFLGSKAVVWPVTVILYGLGNHDAFLNSRDARFYDQMMCSVHWLENHYVALGDGIGWANEEDIPAYHLKAPWFSGLVQGLALSLLIRANILEPGPTRGRLIREIWKGFHVPIDKGGFCRQIENGAIYEEYPGPQLDCVFNGMCHSLIGLWEAWKSDFVPEAEEDFDRGISGLRSLLPRFVYRDWSLYSLNQCLGTKPLLASPFYQRANGVLAQVVGLMAAQPEFCTYGERWLKSSESVARRLRISLRIGIDRFLGASALLHDDKSKPHRSLSPAN